MTALAKLLDQRSQGHVQLSMAKRGVAVLREAGSTKVRVPRGGHEAILINTSGGLAGGDAVSLSLEAGEGAELTATTQAAERIYRTLGPAADVTISLKANAKSSLMWLPHETIFYEGCALSRRIDVELADESTFLALEAMVFGRHESGEVVRRISVQDHWTIRKNGKLIHAEAFKFGPDWPVSNAMLSENRATATLVLIAPQAEFLLDQLRHLIGPQDGVSAWNGKLVARLVAKDGYTLRKALVPLVMACVGPQGVPKCWAM
jgi:urease accessory protein